MTFSFLFIVAGKLSATFDELFVQHNYRFIGVT